MVVTGEPFPGTLEGECNRLKRASGWLLWEGGQLWNVHKGRRRIPAVWERKKVVREASVQLGFPGGRRLRHYL